MSQSKYLIFLQITVQALCTRLEPNTAPSSAASTPLPGLGRWDTAQHGAALEPRLSETISFLFFHQIRDQLELTFSY